jgi:hypothetical protein
LGTVYSAKTEASEISPVEGKVQSVSWPVARGSSTLSVERTDSSGLNHVADGESLDGLVLGGASRAVRASDGLGVAAALLLY